MLPPNLLLAVAATLCPVAGNRQDWLVCRRFFVLPCVHQYDHWLVVQGAGAGADGVTCLAASAIATCFWTASSMMVALVLGGTGDGKCLTWLAVLWYPAVAVVVVDSWS